MKSSAIVALAVLMSSTQSHAADPAYLNVRVLSMDLADQAVMAAARSCRDQGYQVAAAVTDRSGNLLALVRQPLAGAHSVEVARRKAWTAATFQSSTLDLQARGGMQPLNSVEDILIVGGGVPIEVGGRFYGAIGVSGAPAEKVTGDIDDKCAHAGIDAIRETLEFAE